MKEIKLSRGLVAIVDDDVFDYLNSFKWYAQETSKGDFAACRMERQGATQTSVYMHRQLEGQPNTRVSHINGNKLDNRLCNLRATKLKTNRKKLIIPKDYEIRA